jgi:hypothetical protein
MAMDAIGKRSEHESLKLQLLLEVTLSPDAARKNDRRKTIRSRMHQSYVTPIHA